MDRASERGTELGDVWFRFVFPRILSPKRMWKLQKEDSNIRFRRQCGSYLTHLPRHQALGIFCDHLLNCYTALKFPKCLPVSWNPAPRNFIHLSCFCLHSWSRQGLLLPHYSPAMGRAIFFLPDETQRLQPLFTPPSLVSLTQHTISHAYFGHTPLDLLFIRRGCFKEIHGGGQCFPHN